MEKLKTLFIGLSGAGSAELVNAIPDSNTVETILKIVTQIVVLGITLWGLLKPKKEVK